MDFGIALAPGVDAWKTVERAERLGFSHAWYYDTPMLCADGFVAMALAAARTSKIVLGTGVLVPSNRIAPVAANALASLNRLAPGRIVFGVSTGFTARNTMGLGPMKLADLREYVRVVQALLRDETVEWAFEGARRKIRFLNPEAGLIDCAHPIPLHLSAFAPKARALTAEIADGWLNFVTVPPDARYLQLHKGHLMWVRPEEERFVTPELIRMATFTATAAELRERIRALAAAGYQQLAVQVVPGQEDALEDWAEVAATV